LYKIPLYLVEILIGRVNDDRSLGTILKLCSIAKCCSVNLCHHVKKVCQD